MRSILAALVARFKPPSRSKVVAVFGATRAEVEHSIRHARTGPEDLPVWAYCAEELPESGKSIPGCARLISGRAALAFRKDLQAVWPALSIVSWSGKPSPASLKCGPFTMPPFRVLVLNEAGDFFPATPGEIARHLKRRLRDACISHMRRARDRAFGFGAWSGSLAWRASEQVADVFNWGWEVFLAALGRSARWTSPIAYSAVGNLRPRRQEIPCFLAEASDDSFIEVAIPNRGWPRRAIVQAVTNSRTEFLVLRSRGETESAEALIAIARDTNAFAAAKQTAHSAWRRRIVAKHPFRRLQAGEVSEVFAPYSSLIVLRREPLSKLGVPRALTFGGALMILFWKSAAAGLRSLTAGHDGAVTDEPAMELEDAELALRLACSRSLAALGPPHPSRLRGNVAWSPAHRRNFRGKRRVLVVSPYLPFPLSHGGAVRIYNLCRAMADDVDFILACFRESGETVHYRQLHEIFREVYIVDQDEKHRDAAVPKQVAEYRNPAMADLIRSLCAERRIDVVQLEYTQLAEYRDDTGAVPLILVEHDITFTLFRQLAEFRGDAETRREYHRWLAFEREALQCSNMVWTVSDEDQTIALQYGAPRNRTRTIPNGVDLRRFFPVPNAAGPPVVLFVGSFRHLPNLLAFEALRELVMPAVWREVPAAILHVIAGPEHERAALLAGKEHLLTIDSRIVIKGFVEDVRPAYRGADVVAIPLAVSAGTNIKVLEAMACGRAIVSTRAGCQGLDLESGHELIVAALGTSLSDFATAVVDLLRNEDLRMRIATEARKTAERRFGWETIAEEALSCYSALIEKRQSHFSAEQIQRGL